MTSTPADTTADTSAGTTPAAPKKPQPTLDLVNLRNGAGVTLAAAADRTTDRIAKDYQSTNRTGGPVKLQASQITRWETGATTPEPELFACYLRTLADALIQPGQLNEGKGAGESLNNLLTRMSDDITNHLGPFNVMTLLQMDRLLGDEAEFFADWRYMEAPTHDEKGNELPWLPMTPRKCLDRANLTTLSLVEFSRYAANVIGTPTIPVEEFEFDADRLARSFKGVTEYAGGGESKLTPASRRQYLAPLLEHIQHLNGSRRLLLSDIALALDEDPSMKQRSKLLSQRENITGDGVPQSSEQIKEWVEAMLAAPLQRPTSMVTLKDAARLWIFKRMSGTNKTNLTAAMVVACSVATRTPVHHIFVSLMNANLIRPQMSSEEANKLCQYLGEEVDGQSYLVNWTAWIDSKPQRICRSCYGTGQTPSGKACPRCSPDSSDD